MGRIVAQASLLWLVLFAAGCMSSNHDALAASDGGPFILPEASADALEDSAVDPDAFDDALASDSPSSDHVVDAPPTVQPDGPSVFTFIHGIPDSPSIRVCFAVRSGGSFELLPVAPWPADGIAYARAASASAVPGTVELATTDIRPVVLSGDLSQLGASSCDAMDAPPAGVHASALAVIPAGTLTHGRHLLLAAAGCVGGDDTHVDPAQETVCGVGYRPDHPTVTLFVGPVDRTPSPDRVGLQVFTASVATPLSEVDHVIADPVVRTTIASDMAPGAIDPTPPNDDLQPDELGSDVSANTFEIFDSGMPSPSATVLVSAAMARGDVSSQDIVAGSNFTIVLIGPRAGLPDGTWWNGFTMTLLRNSP